jgi:hypothetical protein
LSRDVNARPHPFELMFAGFRETRFPAIRGELRDESGIHAFLLAAAALELLRELRPDDGLGDAVNDFVALVHATYLFWRDGERTVTCDEPATRRLCRPEPATSGRTTLAANVTEYIQIAPRLIWGQLADAEPFEPLDGWFAIPDQGGLRVVACFGVHEQRPGVSVVAVEGRRPARVERPDGTALFAPTMPGGDAAHLHAVSVPEELLLLGWRAGEEIAQWP